MSNDSIFAASGGPDEQCPIFTSRRGFGVGKVSAVRRKGHWEGPLVCDGRTSVRHRSNFPSRPSLHWGPHDGRSAVQDGGEEDLPTIR